MVVGWYHSHPGFGCWLSGVDINTQQVIHHASPVFSSSNILINDLDLFGVFCIRCMLMFIIFHPCILVSVVGNLIFSFSLLVAKKCPVIKRRLEKENPKE